VISTLEKHFGHIEYPGLNWEDFAVTDGYLRTRSDAGQNSRKQFAVPFEDSQEAYLTYQFYLEPGFDAGDGNGGRVVSSTGVKLPGLAGGTPELNTGGHHTAGGFTGRLMIRGTRKSDGDNRKAREGLGLSAYIYGQEINNSSINHGFGRDYLFLNGFDAQPFTGLKSGKSSGVGDPRIWDLPVGEWVTVVLGYRVDGDNGWFRAWTASGTDPLAPRLELNNVNWVGNSGPQTIDSLLFQNFWGGQGGEWYPDNVSYMRFRDFAVYESQNDALAAAR